MGPKLYASFIDTAHAESAAGALLDHGIKPEQFSLIVHDHLGDSDQMRIPTNANSMTVTMLSGQEAGFKEDPLGNSLRSSPAHIMESPAHLNPLHAEDDLDPHKSGDYPTLKVAKPEIGEVDYDAEWAAKTGLTTTTPGDAVAGAVKGAGVGIGIGTIAALAAIVVPGFGLVVGGGALAAALAGLAASAGAGAVAGGTVGFLKDQGVPVEDMPHLSETVEATGSMIEVCLADAVVDRGTLEALLHKYGATAIKFVEGSV